MKPVTCKEAALALGVTTRTIQNKLKNGDLKGLKSTNKYGTEEWRVWPTKEISEGIKKAAAKSNEAFDFTPEASETLEVEEVSLEGVEETLEAPENWREADRQRMELMAEMLIKPLTERLEAQGVALREQEKIIEDQHRQLRLLPNLEKRAEEERKAAELKALEVEALQKQIAALDEQRRAAEAETEQLKSEKEMEAKAIKDQLAALSAQLQELKQPKVSWWQKWFAPSGGE